MMTSELSGGMKKRAGLARAIVMNPEVVLYDEPTSGLDPVMANTINDLISSLQSKLGITSVVVTHDIRSAYKVADRIAMLYNGKIVEAGGPKEIQGSSNPLVKQFVQGKAEGPIQEGMPSRGLLRRWSSRGRVRGRGGKGSRGKGSH